MSGTAARRRLGTRPAAIIELLPAPPRALLAVSSGVVRQMKNLVEAARGPCVLPPADMGNGLPEGGRERKL